MRASSIPLTAAADPLGGYEQVDLFQREVPEVLGIPGPSPSLVRRAESYTSDLRSAIGE